MARTKKKVTEEVTPIEEVVEATTEEIEPDKVSEVMDHEIEETKKEEEEKKEVRKSKEKKESKVNKAFVEIYYTKGITEVDASYVTKALNKAGTEYLFFEINNEPIKNWLKEKGIRGNFAVVIPTSGEDVIVTQYKTALKVLRENGKI